MIHIQFLVFDRTFRMIAELEGELGPTSWVLNGVGKSSFTMRNDDPKVTRRNLRYLNRVLIRFADSDGNRVFPDWTGIIVPDPGRKWRKGEVTINLRSPLYILNHRITPSVLAFEDVPAGQIFAQLIEEANLAMDTGVTPGYVWGGGYPRQRTYNYSNIGEAIALLAEAVGNDFDIVPYNNVPAYADTDRQRINLAWAAQWHLELGHNSPEVVLIEGTNAFEVKLVESGPLVNHWAVTGAGISWEEKPKVESWARDSMGYYGLMEDTKNYPTVLTEETLQDHVNALLEDSKYPKIAVTAKVSDDEPGTFTSYSVGDRITFISTESGFQATPTGKGFRGLVRIVSREYDPRTGFCDLELEETGPAVVPGG